MSDAWIIEAGEYSNECYVVAVFSTLEAAETYMAELKAKDKLESFAVERVDLDPPLPSVVKAATASDSGA